MNISHTQLNVIGIAPSGTCYQFTTWFDSILLLLVGTAFTLPLLGKVVDSRGPRILLVCAFMFLISGYLGMKFFYDSGLPPEAKSLPNLIFGALILCSFLVGSGGSSAYTASVNSTAKTFPDKVVSRSESSGFIWLCERRLPRFYYSADRPRDSSSLVMDCRHLSSQVPLVYFLLVILRHSSFSSPWVPLYR